ncbi:MAG: FAD-dependent oxidoreductase [Cyanophyceae cyanobacterium]
MKFSIAIVVNVIVAGALPLSSFAAQPRLPAVIETCDLLIAGGGLAGSAAAYEALLAGKIVCMTDITDGVGGQISSQVTSALDERPTQRSRLYFPRGYLAFRQRIEQHYGRLNPGACWVSASCFMPYDGHKLLFDLLKDAEKTGKGTLKWYPNPVIKAVELGEISRLIAGALAIQHQPAPNAPPLNTLPLSQTIEDAYRYENSPNFTKTIVQFTPDRPNDGIGAPWYVIDATETGELIGLLNVPHRLGIAPISAWEPSSSSQTGDAYCTQGFTYPFAMEAQAEEQAYQKPDFYDRHAPYYSYELERLADFELVYTYRQIFSTQPDLERPSDVRNFPIFPGDISMQNWTWGNDYRPGSSEDNLIYTQAQLRDTGQLEPGGWLGGLRTETLRRGEEHALGFFYWLVQGTTDSQLGDGVKTPQPFHTLMTGLGSPMGTVHGLSKYPYIREGRRIIGRPGFAYPEGFTVWEVDISRTDFSQSPYDTLPTEQRRQLWARLAGLEAIAVLTDEIPLAQVQSRMRASLYPDSVGIGHYAIDFHPCMTLSPPEAPGNTEQAGERLGQGAAYPFPVPLRATIPQHIDNLLVAGKSIATSHIAAAAYRVHSFEWSVGSAVGTTASFALDEGMMPFELVDDLPWREPKLEQLQRLLVSNGNVIAFPNTSIFNNDWDEWR